MNINKIEPKWFKLMHYFILHISSDKFNSIRYSQMDAYRLMKGSNEQIGCSYMTLNVYIYLNNITRPYHNGDRKHGLKPTQNMEIQRKSKKIE